MSTNNIETLRAIFTAGKVPANDRDFVSSLLRQEGERGLSIKQAAWVDKLVARYTAPPQTPIALPSMTGVVALMDKAKAGGLKFPKLWLQIDPETALRITVAGERSRTPGYLMLTDGGPFGNNRFFGRISPAGALEISHAGEEVREPLLKLLERLAKEPSKVAAEFGHMTGHCCFCSLHLKDERSLAVGYGPQCAEKFGMPWGETPKARKAPTKAAAKRASAGAVKRRR